MATLCTEEITLRTYWRAIMTTLSCMALSKGNWKAIVNTDRVFWLDESAPPCDVVGPTSRPDVKSSVRFEFSASFLSPYNMKLNYLNTKVIIYIHYRKRFNLSKLERRKKWKIKLNWFRVQRNDAKTRRYQWSIIWEHFINWSKYELRTSPNSILISSTAYLQNEFTLNTLVHIPTLIIFNQRWITQEMIYQESGITCKRWMSLETKASSGAREWPSSLITSSICNENFDPSWTLIWRTNVGKKLLPCWSHSA